MTHKQHPLGSGFTAAATADNVLTRIYLTGKNVIVTDGCAGIGLEVSRALIKAGASVTATSRNPTNTAASQGGIEQIQVDRLDLLNPASIDDFVRRWLATERPLQILVNGAGASGGLRRGKQDASAATISDGVLPRGITSLMIVADRISRGSFVSEESLVCRSCGTSGVRSRQSPPNASVPIRRFASPLESVVGTRPLITLCRVVPPKRDKKPCPTPTASCACALRSIAPASAARPSIARSATAASRAKFGSASTAPVGESPMSTVVSRTRVPISLTVVHRNSFGSRVTSGGFSRSLCRFQIIRPLSQHRAPMRQTTGGV